MKYETLGNTNRDPEIAILVPKLQAQLLDKHYYKPHLINADRDVIALDLYKHPTKKKTPAAEIKEYLNDLIPPLIEQGIRLVIVTQPDYFKVLTKQAKTDATIGDVVPTVVKGLHATYCPNYGRIFHDPEKTTEKIRLALESAVRWVKGDTSVTGDDIIKFKAYPETADEIEDWVQKLLDMECDLSCDIEGFGLKHYDAGVGTITFCWNQHEGVAFPVDCIRDPMPMVDENGAPNINMGKNKRIRAAIRHLFETFKHKMLYHNICYDVYVLIYQLFMDDDILNQEGMLHGIDVLLHNWDCTQLISYLATNSCAGNELSLKAQSQAFAGNYAVEDIKDIRQIPMDKLLKYNLIDGLATWYVYDKNWPILMKDQQLGVYNDIFKPAVKDIIQMQLTGMPINMEKVKKLNKQLQSESDANLARMQNLAIVGSFVQDLRQEFVDKKNAEYKKKQIDTKDPLAQRVVFNPGSSKQLQRFLYHEDFLGLPVLDTTDTKLPATGADTLEKLKNHTTDPEVILFLDVLIEFKASAIILSTFLPAFLKAQKGKDGWHYLFGNFRLGGTASGRLSSNGPNLQNIPSSGSTPVKKRLAKLIKECFEAPPGWLFVGLDFDSLEDKISAVTTKDPMKIKVYSDGYDGHCLRALAYFGDKMPDIELAPEGAETYSTEVDGKTVYFHAEEEINYLGTKMTGKEFYDLINA